MIETHKPDILAELCLDCFRHTTLFDKLIAMDYAMVRRTIMEGETKTRARRGGSNKKRYKSPRRTR